MAPLRIRATPEMIEQQQQQQHAQQQPQQPEDAASQASTASQPDETLDADETDAPSDGCIAIDTIEAYTANIQNKKRIFAEEVLNVV
jgi:hemolysin activation/secretion protein